MAYTREELYWIWLASIEGVGPISFKKLTSAVGSPFAVYECAQRNDDLLNILDKKTRKNLCVNANRKYIQQFFSSLSKKGVKAVTQISDDYPKELMHIYDPPLVLYCKGNTKIFNSKLMIAMVGTRRATQYGKTVADRIGENLGRNEVVVVSGMARGIDSYSHIGCLKGDGKTIAILGCGVDIVYPKENDKLYNDIIETGGVIASEYIPGTVPLPAYFPGRNRIISGIAKGLVVVEAAERSGTSFTVKFALEQGKDVFAVPGNITSKYSMTTNKLIKEGVEVATSAQDIMDYYDWRSAVAPTSGGVVQPNVQEAKIIGMLENSQYSFDEIYNMTDFTIPQLAEILINMEIKGIVKQLPGRRYTL